VGELDRRHPLPPLHLAERVGSLEGSGEPFEAYQRLGAERKAAILELLPDGWAFEGRRVLDFGCGAGRTLRHFLEEARAAELRGVDIDAESVEWLNRSLCPPLHAGLAPEAPPLRFDSGSFDLIWALSVFTHLTDHSAKWMLELHRLLKPGGLLLATYMGRWNSQAFLEEAWEEDRIGMNVLRADQGWDEGGPLVLMSDWWVREHWERAFEFEATKPQMHGQTWVMLRRREVSLSAWELERPADDPRELRALRHNVTQVVSDERAFHQRRAVTQILHRFKDRILLLAAAFRSRARRRFGPR
jgi:SAM-dependent methyltransferase